MGSGSPGRGDGGLGRTLTNHLEARALALSGDATLAWMLDSGEVRFVNRAAREVYGSDHAQLVGRSRETLTPMPAPYETLVERLRASGRWHAEVRHGHDDGRVLRVHLSVMLGDPGGSLVLEVASDVTAEREAVAALRAARENMDWSLATLAHELRRPLSALDHAVALHDEQPDGEEARKARGVMRRQVTQMRRLVDDLLDLSRVAHGKTSLRRRPVDLARLVEQAVEDAGSLVRGAGSIAVDAEPVTAEVDPARIGQVLGNLLSNAVKHSPPPVAIRVSLAREADAAVIAVQDDGEGMTAAQLARAFEPFHQAADRAGAGLGIGLAVTRAIVERHGGRVTAHSEGPGRGARFEVRLPGRDAPASQPSEVPAGATILIVDDDEDQREMLALLLRARGFAVDTSRDAAEGLERARAQRPDVVLSDLALGGSEDGWALAERLRALPELNGCLLIAASGHATERDRARSEAAGFDAHLQKPLRVDVLIEEIASRHDKRSTVR